MRIFDSHCHLDDAVFDGDRAAVLLRAHAAGVRAMLVAGISLASSLKAVRLAEKEAGVYAAVGVHPHDVKHCSTAQLSELRRLAGRPAVHAWGEIGLDFNRMYSPRSDQEHWFLRQLEMADALDLPLIFHERDSGGRFLTLLQSRPRPARRGVVHCFSGSDDELDAYLSVGLHIGITGILTLQGRGAALRRMVTRIPLQRLLVETDAPYLTPAPEKNRTRRNEPAFVKSTLLCLAEVRGEAPEVLAAAVWENTCRLFGVSASPQTVAS
jgi:TatD DNase family protein